MKLPIYIIRVRDDADYSERVVCASQDMVKVLKTWKSMTSSKDLMLKGDYDDEVTIYYDNGFLILSGVTFGEYYECGINVRFLLETKLPMYVNNK